MDTWSASEPARPREGFGASGSWIIAAVLVACALFATALQTRSPMVVNSRGSIVNTTHIVLALVALAASLAAARRRWDLPDWTPAALPWIAGALCLITGWLAGSFWANSADEHSYTYLADTLIAGRFSNPAPPDPELFRHWRIYTVAGHSVSQYPPGWPLALAPFRALGLDCLAGPLFTVLLGGSLLGAMRRLAITPAVQAGALALVLFSPFVLFNGGSVFSHTLTAALAAAIVWQQLADEGQPSFARKALIGALFGALLLTRYESFAILAVLYAADRLWHRRAAALLDAAPMLLGALPFVALCLGYDWAVTGDPLRTPAAVTNPDMTFGEAVTGPLEMARRAAAHTAQWTGLLGQFGGLTLLVLQVPALLVKLRRRTVRFYDLALPATVLFFLYFPWDGGHQYGARYWFFAWPLAVLTVVTGLVAPDGTFRLGARTFAFRGLVAATLVFFAASLPGLIVTTRVYIEARRAVLDDPVPVTPALVLVPSRGLTLWPWQGMPIPAPALDFARFDVDFSDPVIYGRLDPPDAIARACRVPGRTVFVWFAPGLLLRPDCPEPRP